MPVQPFNEKKLTQDAEKVALLTRPTPARRDAPFPRPRSRIAQRLNVPKRTPHLFARCGLARGTARLGAPGLGG